MQGTLVLLMALSGMGCHHKKSEVVVAPACYSSCYGGGSWDGCHSASYVSGCYSSPVVVEACYSSCYDGGHSACYGGGCHGGKRHGGLLSKLFGHKKHRDNGCHDVVYSSCYDACYSSGYAACHSMPVYGSYTPAYVSPAWYPSGQGVSGQAMIVPDKGWPSSQGWPSNQAPSYQAGGSMQGGGMMKPPAPPEEPEDDDKAPPPPKPEGDTPPPPPAPPEAF